MAIVAPFKGVTYALRLREALADLVAPPYDVISEREQEGFHQAHPYNIIRLILGKKRIGDSDWDNRYTRAADCFARWTKERVLVRAQEPLFYITSVTHDPGDGGAPQTRWGFIGLLRIEDEESGVVLPHERTFSAHKEDRLKLMRTCQAQFSQIFAVYEDPQDLVMRACAEELRRPAPWAFRFKDGTHHAMWAISGDGPRREIVRALADKTLLIADGHHRYETARNYRNLMRARYGTKARNRAYDYVMAYLSNMSQEGLTILPAHRLIKTVRGCDTGLFLERLAPWFTVVPFPLRLPIDREGAAALKTALGSLGKDGTALGFYPKGASQVYLLRLREPARGAMGDDLHPSLKGLDVLVLSRLIFQKSLGFTLEDLDREDLFRYESGMEAALASAATGEVEMAFLLNPTRIAQVKEIAGHRLIMPRKSTYFYPKVITGLVLNTLDPDERIGPV